MQSETQLDKGHKSVAGKMGGGAWGVEGMGSDTNN